MSVAELTKLGFQEIGAWKLSSDGLILELTSMREAKPALYAFVVDGEVAYVGKTIQPLLKRLYGYLKPGESQVTNIRNRLNILNALNDDKRVTILGFHNPKPEYLGRFEVNLPAALEDSIIESLEPEWNATSRGKIQNPEKLINHDRKQQEGSSSISISKVSHAKENRLRPSFNVRIGDTYYKSGFFNVPVDYARYFADHNSTITIDFLKSGQSIIGKINRTANQATYAPRIMGGAMLKEWIHGNVKLGSSLKVTVVDSRHITLGTT